MGDQAFSRPACGAGQASIEPEFVEGLVLVDDVEAPLDVGAREALGRFRAVSYTHLRAHET